MFVLFCLFKGGREKKKVQRHNEINLGKGTGGAIKIKALQLLGRPLAVGESYLLICGLLGRELPPLCFP